MAAARLPSLTGLRFVAAVMVFGFHLRNENAILHPRLRQWVETVFGLGLTGVGFFFVLSGFVLAWSARPEEPARAFWRRRAARIWPNHLVMAAVVVVVGLKLRFLPPLEHGPTLANLALVQCWKPDQRWYFSLNSPSWSLSCEAFFYLMFPCWHGLLRRLPGRALLPAAVLLVGAVWAVPAVVWQVAPAQTPTTWWIIYYLPLTRCAEFLLGIVLALAVRAGRFPPVPFPVAAAVTVASYQIATRHLPWPLSIVAGTVAGFALLVPAAVLADLRGRRTVIGNRLFVWLGDRSFALYLVQYPVIAGGHRLLARSGHGALHGTAALAAFTAAFALSLLLAALLHACVETPAYRLLGQGGQAGRRV
ncbi:MAG: acyltransferase family protein [Mycobacteriales bacterium]